MTLQGLFIRGIFSSVLEEIRRTHLEQPDRTLYLQPYRGDPIKMLRDNPPTMRNPVRLYLSTSEDPATVSYTADIVGWENKLELSQSRKLEIEAIIKSVQPGEKCLYNKSKTPGRPSLNLVHIRRLVKLPSLFGVTNLIKISDGKPYSPDREAPGGWSPVRLV